MHSRSYNGLLLWKKYQKNLGQWDTKILTYHYCLHTLYKILFIDRILKRVKNVRKVFHKVHCTVILHVHCTIVDTLEMFVFLAWKSKYLTMRYFRWFSNTLKRGLYTTNRMCLYVVTARLSDFLGAFNQGGNSYQGKSKNWYHASYRFSWYNLGWWRTLLLLQQFGVAH